MARRRIPWFLPTRRLAIVVAMSAPVWLLSGTRTGVFIASVIGVTLALATIGDAILAPAASDISVRRSLSPSVGMGDSATGQYELRTRWLSQRVFARWPSRIRLALHHAMPRGVSSSETLGTWMEVSARGSVSLPFTVTGRERGRFELGPVAVQVRGPLGLVQRVIRVDTDDHITVVPSMSGVRRYRLLSLQHRMRDVGVRATRRRGEGTSFANLREYVPGDDPRHIEWKATARRRKLITREYAVEQGQTIMIAIDAGRMMTQLAGPMTRFEHVLSSAMVLADVSIQSGDRVGAIVFDHEVRAFLTPEKGQTALRNLRNAIAPLTASMTEPDYAMAFRTLAARHRKRSLIVLFTDVIDPRASRSLIAHTSRSAARHLAVVVALRNDALVALSVPGETASSSDLYESAAAEELLAARNEAILRMRRSGVSVLDVSPHTMTAAVINQYLAVKARSSL
ncbi:MAG: DUF58 domain-containing protein [Gemmatimonadaceae bacterium]